MGDTDLGGRMAADLHLSMFQWFNAFISGENAPEIKHASDCRAGG